MRFAPVVVLMSLILSACAAPSVSPKAEAPEWSDSDLVNRLRALPGAEISGQPPVIRYPGEGLFATGSALPLPGGTAVLEPLAELIVSTRPLRWRATVRATTGLAADYDETLAASRVELLGRYFVRRGIGSDQLLLVPETGPGAPLELVIEPAQPAISANSFREKP